MFVVDWLSIDDSYRITHAVAFAGSWAAAAAAAAAAVAAVAPAAAAAAAAAATAASCIHSCNDSAMLLLPQPPLLLLLPMLRYDMGGSKTLPVVIGCFGIKMYILKYDHLCFATLNNIRIKITKMAATTPEHLICVK